MRSLKELYQILLDDRMKNSYYGICTNINHLLYGNSISDDEFFYLKQHFRKQFPRKGCFFGLIGSKNEKFTKDISFTDCKGYYWWKTNEEGNKQRILFLQHIISKL